jgi:hypothetical protein
VTTQLPDHKTADSVGPDQGPVDSVSTATPTQQVPTQRQERSWLKLTAAVLFVISVAGAFSYVMRDDLVVPKRDTEAFGGSSRDDFDRPASDSTLGETDTGQIWQPVAGVWGIDASKAVLNVPGEDESVVLLESMSTGRIEASVGGSGACGVVAGFFAADEYIVLFQVPGFAVWNLAVRNGADLETIANLPYNGSRDNNISLTIGNRVVTAEVGFLEVSIVVDEPDVPPGESGYGLFATGDKADQCTWDNVEVEPGQ